MLNDLVQEESYLEIRAATNSSLSASGGQSGTDEGRGEVGQSLSLVTGHSSPSNGEMGLASAINHQLSTTNFPAPASNPSSIIHHPSSAADGEVGNPNSPNLSPATCPLSLLFALRLNPAQAGQWRTNLPVVLESLTGSRAVTNPDQSGWSLPTPAGFIQLSRVGDWTLVAAGPQYHPLSDEIAARIRRDGVPFVSAGTNLWLEAEP